MENYKVPLSIKILDKILAPFIGKKLDYEAVRRILILKLTLDARRVPLSMQNPNKKKKAESEPKQMKWLSYLMYIFFGVIIAVLQMINNPFVANVFGFGVVIFMLLSFYISDYSTVLLDTTEKAFYSVLPVGEEEKSLAKTIHIALYLGEIATTMLLPSMIVGMYYHGAMYGLLYLLMGIGTAFFCLYLAGGLYYLLLQLFSGEKLKDILNIFQVVMTIGIALAYQIIPRVIDFKAIATWEPAYSPFWFLLPSAWFSAIFAIVVSGQYQWHYFALTAFAIVVLTGLTLLYRKVIVPQFEKKLSKLEVSSLENKSLSRWDRFICRRLSASEQERGFMEFMKIHISRDRNLKMKLYPQLANVFILPAIIIFSFFFSGRQERVEVFAELQKGPYYLILYSIALFVSTIYMVLCQTDNKNTVWIYQILPVKNVSQFVKTGVKLVLFYYLTPLFWGMAIFFLAISYGRSSLDILIIYVISLLFSTVMIRLTAWKLPFSFDSEVKFNVRNMLIGLISFPALGALAVLHYFFLTNLWIKLAVLVISLGLNLLWWRFCMNKNIEPVKE